MRWAKIWVSSPHEVDGIYVELIEKLTPKSKNQVITDSIWLPTYDTCEQWAHKNGATRIETV